MKPFLGQSCWRSHYATREIARHCQLRSWKYKWCMLLENHIVPWTFFLRKSDYSYPGPFNSYLMGSLLVDSFFRLRLFPHFLPAVFPPHLQALLPYRHSFKTALALQAQLLGSLSHGTTRKIGRPWTLRLPYSGIDMSESSRRTKTQYSLLRLGALLVLCPAIPSLPAPHGESSCYQGGRPHDLVYLGLRCWWRMELLLKHLSRCALIHVVSTVAPTPFASIPVYFRDHLSSAGVAYVRPFPVWQFPLF